MYTYINSYIIVLFFILKQTWGPGAGGLEAWSDDWSNEMGWQGLTSRSSGKTWHPLPSTLLWLTDWFTNWSTVLCVMLVSVLFWVTWEVASWLKASPGKISSIPYRTVPHRTVPDCIYYILLTHLSVYSHVYTKNYTTHLMMFCLMKSTIFRTLDTPAVEVVDAEEVLPPGASPEVSPGVLPAYPA